MNWRVVRSTWRLLLMLICLLFGLVAALTVMRSLSTGHHRALVRRWARWTLLAAGVRVRLSGKNLEHAGLILANHVSWLDILVIDSVAPCHFIAKVEIRRWPLVGFLCARAGTIFIERGRRHAVHAVIETARQQLQAGDRVAVFAEGTTSDGTIVLPFHANLVEAAVRSGCPVQPLALRYEDTSGQRSRAIEFIGATTFPQSLWRVLGEPLTTAVLVPLEPLGLTVERTRHALAKAAEIAVRQALFPAFVADDSAVARTIDLNHPTIAQSHSGEFATPDTARVERNELGAIDESQR